MKSLVWIALLSIPAAAISQTPPAPGNSSGRPSAQTPDQATVQAASEAFRAGHAAMDQNNLTLAQAEFAKVVQLLPQVAAGHSALGAVLYAEGNPTAAVPELEQAHTLDPRDDTATLNLALSYSQLNAYNKALPLFRQLDTSGAQFAPGDLAFYARTLDATGDPESARAKLVQALAQDPNNAALHDSLGTVLAEQNKLSDARPEFDRALQLDPNLASAHLHLGSLLLVQQNYPAAIAELQKAVALAPNDLQSSLQLGRALAAAGENDAAIAAFRHALQLNPGSIDAKYALALALQSAGQTKDAIPLFQETVAARPADPAALTNLGLALVQTGDAKNGLACYQRALALDPQNAILHEDTGVAWLQQADLEHAIAEFRAGLALDPDNPQLNYDLGLALKLQDKVSEAIPALEKAAQEDPSLADPPFTLGILYMQMGRFPDAARDLEKSLAMRPNNGDAWSILGSVYKQMDQPDKAVPALRRAIELLPSQPSPHIVLASILAERGDIAGAAAERKKAADLSRVAISRQRAKFNLDSGTQLLKQGKLADALVQLRQAVAADPTYADAHRALADALAQQGDAAGAALERQKATALDSQPHASATPPVQPQ